MSCMRRASTKTVCTLHAMRPRRFVFCRLGDLCNRSGNQERSILKLPMGEDGSCEVCTQGPGAQTLTNLVAHLPPQPLGHGRQRSRRHGLRDCGDLLVRWPWDRHYCGGQSSCDSARTCEWYYFSFAQSLFWHYGAILF